MWRWVVATALLVACSDAKPQPTLIVEIFGSKTAFEGHDVTVSPLNAAKDLEFRSPFMVKKFTTVDSLASAEKLTLDLTSTVSGQPISHFTWHPFVCSGDLKYQEKLQSGWSGKETLQATLGNDGTISVYSEFEHSLYNECEWKAPDSKSGEGAGSLSPTPMLCNEEDRLNTSLSLAELTNGQSVPFTATYCQALHFRPKVPDPDFSGSIVNQFVGTLSDGSMITLSLSHCWATSESYPVDVPAQTASPGGCGGMAISIESGGIGYQIPPSSGHWTLSNGPDLAGGAHQISDFDLVFGVADGSGRRFSVSGHVDLPIVKAWNGRLR
jgi:hypothetical protein